MKYFILLVSYVVFLFSCTNPCDECGCDNVDDCLSKNKFEEARRYAALEDKKNLGPTERRRVAFSEAQYWINENEFLKALPLIKEVGGKEHIKLLNEIVIKKIALNQIEDVQLYYLSFPDRTYEDGLNNIWDNENSVADCNKIKYDLSMKIIRLFCENKMIERAKSFSKFIPESIIISSLEKNLQDRDEKLYYKIKEQFKENQAFYEPWQGYISGYYHIVTYKYPRKEALDIIDEYNKLK